MCYLLDCHLTRWEVPRLLSNVSYCKFWGMKSINSSGSLWAEREKVFFFEMWFDISCIVLNAIPVHSFTDSESLSDISCLASRSWESDGEDIIKNSTIFISNQRHPKYNFISVISGFISHWSQRVGFRGPILARSYCSSQPSIVHWLSSSIFPCLVVRSSCHGNIWPNLTSSCPTTPNPYIFRKLMIIAIQKWIRNTNTKTKTNTKTITKTKTPRE